MKMKETTEIDTEMGFIKLFNSKPFQKGFAIVSLISVLLISAIEDIQHIYYGKKNDSSADFDRIVWGFFWPQILVISLLHFCFLFLACSRSFTSARAIRIMVVDFSLMLLFAYHSYVSYCHTSKNQKKTMINANGDEIIEMISSSCSSRLHSITSLTSMFATLKLAFAYTDEFHDFFSEQVVY
uniref:Uncharacterized protein n=1 Tax=Cannabis sativa TaxID=3483 RepID=A0A803PEK1_CANSA